MKSARTPSSALLSSSCTARFLATCRPQASVRIDRTADQTRFHTSVNRKWRLRSQVDNVSRNAQVMRGEITPKCEIIHEFLPGESASQLHMLFEVNIDVHASSVPTGAHLRTCGEIPRVTHFQLKPAVGTIFLPRCELRGRRLSPKRAVGRTLALTRARLRRTSSCKPECTRISDQAPDIEGC